MRFESRNIFIRPLLPEDIGESYIAWMNDPEVTQYLESRGTQYLHEDLVQYVKDIRKNDNNLLFGIFLKGSGEHIGNIKIGNISRVHRFADVGLVIGVKEQWGKGYATEAIRLVTEYAFEQLDLNKLVAGMYAPNEGSRKAFEKAGYNIAGRYRNHRFYKGSFVDEILVEQCREDINGR